MTTLVNINISIHINKTSSNITLFVILDLPRLLLPALKKLYCSSWYFGQYTL